MALDALSDLPDITPEEPAGPNLEFDPDFIELERAAQGKAEQQYGTLIVPAEEPVWKDVAAQATELLARTYDLRVLAHLTVARLHQQGLPGYAAGLAVTRAVLQTRWSSVHPVLDPEDDNDPTLRSNALLRLAEPARVLRVVRDIPLARSPRAGAVSWRDVAVAAGQMEPDPGKDKLSEATIQGAFRETDPAALAALREAVAAAIADVKAIPAVFDTEAGYGTGPELGELSKLLGEIVKTIDRYAVAPDDAPVPIEDGFVTGDPLAGTPGGGAPPAASASRMATQTAVTSRADAMRLLDLIIDYYERNEPSSPVQLLIGRARRLADMSFIDLLRELAPDGLSQAETVTGRQESSSD